MPLNNQDIEVIGHLDKPMKRVRRIRDQVRALTTQIQALQAERTALQTRLQAEQARLKDGLTHAGDAANRV